MQPVEFEVVAPHLLTQGLEPFTFRNSRTRHSFRATPIPGAGLRPPPRNDTWGGPFGRMRTRSTTTSNAMEVSPQNYVRSCGRHPRDQSCLGQPLSRGRSPWRHRHGPSPGGRGRAGRDRIHRVFPSDVHGARRHHGHVGESVRPPAHRDRAHRSWASRDRSARPRHARVRRSHIGSRHPGPFRTSTRLIRGSRARSSSRDIRSENARSRRSFPNLFAGRRERPRKRSVSASEHVHTHRPAEEVTP